MQLPIIATNNTAHTTATTTKKEGKEMKIIIINFDFITVKVRIDVSNRHCVEIRETHERHKKRVACRNSFDSLSNS